MKKRIMSIVLTCALVLSMMLVPSGTADAAGTDMFSGKTKKTMETATTNARAGLQETDEFKVATLLYDTTEPVVYTPSFNPGEYIYSPFTVKNTGKLYFDFAAYSVDGTSNYVYVQLCDGNGVPVSDCSATLGNGSVLSSMWGVSVKAGQKYYLQIETANYNKGELAVLFAGSVLTTYDRTLSGGKVAIASGIEQDGSTASTYFKVQPSKTGRMKVELQEIGYNSTYATVRLYNSKKTLVSDKVSYNGSPVYFGVKKGNTYYIRITDAKGSYDNYYAFGVKYTMSSYTDRALGSKSSAKTLKRKASATNTLFVASTGTSTDWYKFNVSSKRTTAIRVKTAGMSSGKLTLTVYRGSKKVGTTSIGPQKDGSFSITYGTTRGKANAGTYYVKVVKSKSASGQYSIQYQK